MTSLTAPWDDRAEAAVRQTLRHVVVARATHPDWPEPIPLDVIGGTVTFDETWAPHVQASVTCALPSDAATLAALDPRRLVRVELDVGYIYPGGVQDVHLLANLGLRERSVRRPAGQVILVAASDEALVQDAGPLLDSVLMAPSWEVGAAIIARLPIPLGYAPTIVNTVPGTATATAHLDSTTDQWPAFKEWADAAQAWLYDRGDRVWVLCSRPTVAAQPVHLLKTGANGTVVDSDTTLSRDSWANMVVVRHEWTDSDGTAQTVIGRAWVTSGPHQGWDQYNSRPLPGLRTYIDKRDTPGTVDSARASAYAILTRLLRAASSVTLTARSAYWVRPGMTVAVQLPTGGEELHLVTKVTFDLATCQMTITTRQPDTSVTINTGA